MEKFIQLGIFGYQRWGNLRPVKVTLANGRVYRPMFLGIWMRFK